MKPIYYLFFSALIVITLFISGQQLIRHFSKPYIAISIRDKPESYQLKATFPEEKSYAIAQAIGEELYPEVLFACRNTIEENVQLPDGTSFSISAAPGYLEINASKTSNTAVNLIRIKKLCERLSKLIGS